MAVVDKATGLRPTVLLRCCTSNAEYNDELLPIPDVVAVVAAAAAADDDVSGDKTGRLSCRAAGTTGGRGRLIGWRLLLAVAAELGDSRLHRRETQPVHD